MAVQIARIEGDSLHLDAAAFKNVLDKVGAQPVAVVAVSGPLQEGKSSITNRLLRMMAARKDRGEDMDGLHQTELAEVLWKKAADQPNQVLLWPEPLEVNHNGRSTAVLLMSVHGNLDGTVTTMDNALIFALGCLLASVTVYHVKNGLSEDMLRFLQMAIANAKAVSHQEDCCPFAKMLFVVNDWQLPGEYIYGYHEDMCQPSMRNFKKEALNVLTGIMPESRVVRQEVLSSFQEVCCCLVPKFGDEMFEVVGPLQDLGSWIFRDGCSIIKTVRGMAVSGTELKGLVQEWAGSLVISKIPAFRTALEAPGEVADAAALSVALAFFRTEMTSAIYGQMDGLSNDQFRSVHARKMQEAVAMVERLTTAEHRKYEAALQAELDESLGPFLHMNAERRFPVHVREADAAITKIWWKRKENRRGICCLIISLKVIVAIILIFRIVRHYNKRET